MTGQLSGFSGQVQMEKSGKPNTYAYWTGNYDGTTFTPDMDEPQWLDHGFDWYGAVTFKDGKMRIL